MNPGLAGEEAFLLAPGTVTIGRTSDNPIVCTHKSLSRKHAQVDYDGQKVRITDLQSKNGVFFNGERVTRCELVEGDSFRCGDVTFLVEGATTRQPKVSIGVQTLPSPLAIDVSMSKRTTKVTPSAAVVDDDDQRYKDKLFLLIHASELIVGDQPLDRVLDELVVLAVQVLAVDRIALLVLDEKTLAIAPKVIKTFVGASLHPYSKRVVDWVVDRGVPASFGDVSRDKTLPGDPSADIAVRSAMAVPIDPGGGTIGVLYADNVSQVDAFRTDDLALFRALANMVAVAMDNHALRRDDRDGGRGVTKPGR